MSKCLLHDEIYNFTRIMLYSLSLSHTHTQSEQEHKEVFLNMGLNPGDVMGSGTSIHDEKPNSVHMVRANLIQKVCFIVTSIYLIPFEVTVKCLMLRHNAYWFLKESRSVIGQLFESKQLP